jgi:hypothetical protein
MEDSNNLQRQSPKDRWIASGGVEAITYPSVPDKEAEGHASTSYTGASETVPTSNPEIPGGSITLVAIHNNIVREPPSSQARMRASHEKQVAFNERGSRH